MDATEGNIVLISLSNETMYDDDSVSVSYNPGTLNYVRCGCCYCFFRCYIKIPKKPNLFATTGFSNVDYSFETSTVSNFPYLWWGGVWGEYDLSMSYNQAYRRL